MNNQDYRNTLAKCSSDELKAEVEGIDDEVKALHERLSILETMRGFVMDEIEDRKNDHPCECCGGKGCINCSVR